MAQRCTKWAIPTHCDPSDAVASTCTADKLLQHASRENAQVFEPARQAHLQMHVHCPCPSPCCCYCCCCMCCCCSPQCPHSPHITLHPATTCTHWPPQAPSSTALPPHTDQNRTAKKTIHPEPVNARCMVTSVYSTTPAAAAAAAAPA